MDNPVEMVGLPSPWPSYNAAIGGGWRRKAVSMLGARSGVGKSILADNAAKHATDVLKIPTLYLDTEMNAEDHWYRVGANISNVTINEIETGKCGVIQAKRERVMGAIEKVEGLPFYYLNVSGISFEETLSIVRRWIHKVIGFHPDGKTKDCLIMYDYVKLMGGEDIKFNVAEYQILGFMMTSLHNLAVRNDVPIFALIQLNRDGIDKEDAGAVAGSDRVIWLTTNFGIFKPKSDEEIAAGGLDFGTHKLVILKQRHGPGLARGDYINMFMKGEYAQITEGKTRFQLLKATNTIQPPDEQLECEDIPFGDSNEEPEPEEL
jgi:replicative DNA helicase